MNTRKIILGSIWLLLTIFIIDITTNFLTQPDTIKNVVGYLLFIVFYVVSYETKCLTNLKFKRKHEK